MTRRLPLILVAVVTVLCVVGVSIAAVAAGGSALAYSVNGTRVSQKTIDGQLDDLANTKATTGASKTDGSISSQAAAQVITINIVREVLRDAAERQGKKVTDQDRKQARSSVVSQLSGYPSSYVDVAVDVQAYGNALGLQDSNALNAFLVQQFGKADVQVNPRYGTWHPRTGVCPPSGCVSTSSGG